MLAARTTGVPHARGPSTGRQRPLDTIPSTGSTTAQTRGPATATTAPPAGPTAGRPGVRTLSFANLGLSADLLRAVADEGYTEPTPIQHQAIPVIIGGHDVLGTAQTGTGKTAAFVLPILERLKAYGNTSFSPARHPVRALILAPTRELAVQVEEMARGYAIHSALRTAVVYGGVPIEPQAKQLLAGVEILVATPGRLLDHMGSRTVNLGQVEILVLDEADRMLDMGFMPDIRRILDALPSQRQNLLFSATFSDDVRSLSDGILDAPVRISVAPANATADLVRQIVYPVDRDRKEELLAHLIRSYDLRQVLVFTRTKLAAARLASWLDRRGIEATAIHGDRNQTERTKALEMFKAGEVRVLVATDVAARGLDIEELPHVVNFELPFDPQDYIHRIGRTARAGVGRRRDQPGVHRRDRPAARRPAAAAAGHPLDGRGGLHPRSERGAAPGARARGARRWLEPQRRRPRERVRRLGWLWRPLERSAASARWPALGGDRLAAAYSGSGSGTGLFARSPIARPAERALRPSTPASPTAPAPARAAPAPARAAPARVPEATAGPTRVATRPPTRAPVCAARTAVSAARRVSVTPSRYPRRASHRAARPTVARSESRSACVRPASVSTRSLVGSSSARSAARRARIVIATSSSWPTTGMMPGTRSTGDARYAAAPRTAALRDRGSDGSPARPHASRQVPGQPAA